ncbi:MAG: tRNA (adenosine(37)-N6)-threonylcarbamoyltransferase complex ATPase subunit type 1 TsaE [Chlamydiales bacterium]|nr:tRNA (adenosine(37)-N6)-threonylcarbamoyltransferase complex ATPase subunit type 1 TsaE [Chlamydiales bacterium]
MSSKLTSTAGSKKINKFVSSSPEETAAIGQDIARSLTGNELICLHGDLGAGKTTLSKGLISAFAKVPPHEVNSPTFTYLNVYEGEKTVFHFDCYRLNGEEDFWEKGFDEYFGELCLIEWSEKIEKALPTKRINITISYHGETGREITIETD